MNFSIAWQKINDMGRDFMALLPNLILGAIVFVIFLFIAGGVQSLVLKVVASRQQSQSLTLLLSRLAYVLMLIIGVLVTFTVMIPSFTPTTLISALGVGGVAIGFAFKDIFQNFLAGILLLLTEPFKINDQIKYKDFEGTVETIQTRATTIQTYDGRRVVIPNAELFINAITVNTAYDKRRLEYDFGIGYGDNIGKTRQLMLETVAAVPGVLKEPAPEALVVEIGESTINIRLRWWINPPRRADYMQSKDQVLEAIKNKLTEAGIDQPFPTRVVLFHDQTEETDGDRRAQREGWPAGKGPVPRPAREVAHTEPEPTPAPTPEPAPPEKTA